VTSEDRQGEPKGEFRKIVRDRRHLAQKLPVSLVDVGLRQRIGHAVDQHEIGHEEERVQQRSIEINGPVGIFASFGCYGPLERGIDFVDFRVMERIVVADHGEPIELAKPLLEPLQRFRRRGIQQRQKFAAHRSLQKAALDQPPSLLHRTYGEPDEYLRLRALQSLLDRIADLTLSLLNKEVARLRALIGIDTENAKAFARLSEKISRDEAALAKLDRDIDLAEKADDRIKELIQSRRDSYASVFDGIIDEERELSALYAPLRARLGTVAGALGKLSFSIRRVVDVGTWAQSGEELLDLRKAGPFKGRGALLAAAKTGLQAAWEKGSSGDVADAMARFREAHERDLVEHAPVERSNAGAFREWAGRISSWLYGTDHITVSYGVQYEGVDIEQLSPGTRGIVLLLLYLAIDRDDDRPLIIDQPEENLDPKSIFDELVGRFRRAKQRRQIIIVTHNANLVVNTDADQVIVATCGPHRPGQLPEITYQSGGLENPDIRRLVCEILEGGETAFRERARRLRVKM
jgi:AAA domain, putative AbiEii toxin, Type IV TA system